MLQAVPGLVTSIDLCKMWAQDHNQDQSSYANDTASDFNVCQSFPKTQTATKEHLFHVYL